VDLCVLGGRLGRLKHNYFLRTRVKMAIDNTNKCFHGQQREEILIYMTRKHWMVLLPIFMEFLVVFAIITGAILTAIPFFGAGIGNFLGFLIIGGMVIITVWIHYLFIEFLNNFLDTAIVTNYRVLKIEKSLFLKNNMDMVDLHEIQDIKKMQDGIMENLFNYGKLVIVVPTMLEPLVLNSIPDPERFFRKVNNAKRDYIYERQQRKLTALTQNQRLPLDIFTNEISGATRA